MATAIVPGIYDPALADEDIGVGTEEAFELTRRLAREGLFVGISSGANLAGALRVARADVGRGDRRGLLRRRREVPVRAVLGRERAGRRALMGADAASRVSPTRSARHGVETYPERVLRRAVSAATASSRPRSRCRTRPRKGRGAGSSCGRRTIARPSGARAELGAELLGLLSLASGSSGAAVAVRSRPRVAVLLVHHRLRARRRARRHDVVAPARRPLRLRSRKTLTYA